MSYDRPRDPAAPSAHRRTEPASDLARHDESMRRRHQADRYDPDGRLPPYVKDDRRSSAVLTERERRERWPIG